jgi:crotonobetainyl-CoA:carnitine CoA-transferase CaiB-like acyl-CoA transferase
MSRILADVRVLEVCNFVSGPWACQMLAELGADVVKIENPRGGDPFRTFSPDGYSPAFCAHNRHKRSVTLDLANAGAAQAFRRLAETADVVVENFRPGVMDKLGIGWDALSAVNPRLVYCSVSGFGPTGPYRDRPAYDTVIQALSGVLGQFLPPDNPRIAGINIADSVAALCAVIGVLGGLVHRERTGRGTHVDVPMLDALVAFSTNPIAQFFATGTTPGPYQRPAHSQCFVFECADRRKISVHMSAPHKFWLGLLRTIGRPELDRDPRFDSNPKRIANFDELGVTLAPSFRQRERADWERLLAENDVPYAPVNDYEELVRDPQVIHQRIFTDLDHPTKGRTVNIARPCFFDGERAFGERPPPTLGEHTDEVLLAAGLAKNELDALRAAKAI